MKNIFTLSGIFLLTAIIFQSCQKYEENPLINLHSKCNRVEGSYFLAGYYVNGMDSTAIMNEELASWYGSSFEVHFFASENSKVISGSFCQGDWELVDSKKMLRINISNSSASAVGPFATKEQLDWRITKLTDNHLHLKAEHMGLEYVVQLHEN